MIYNDIYIYNGDQQGIYDDLVTSLVVSFFRGTKNSDEVAPRFQVDVQL